MPLSLVTSVTRLTLAKVAGVFVFWGWLRTNQGKQERSLMDVIITSKTLQVTQALRAAAVRQAEKLFRFGKKILKVRVSLEVVNRKKNDLQATIVQYQVDLPGRRIVVRRKARDMYEALVDAASSAARQVRKTKEKRLFFKRGYRSAFATVPVDRYYGK